MATAPTFSPTAASGSCQVPPCILWGVSTVYFVTGCILIVVAILARFIVRLLIVVLSAILKRWHKGYWTDLLHNLWICSTWFLRFGALFGVALLWQDEQLLLQVASQAIYYIFAVPFCIAWLWFTYVFTGVIAKAIVIEFSLRELKDTSTKRDRLKPSDFKSGAPLKAGQTARSTSLSQVLLIFRVIIMIVVLAMICSILGIGFTNALNETAIWFLPITYALLQHFRSIYYGGLFMFLYTDDDWTAVQPGNTCQINGDQFETIQASLARVSLRRGKDNAKVIVPLNYFLDQGAETELKKEVPILATIRIKLKQKLDTDQLQTCCDMADQFVSEIHPCVATYRNNASLSTLDMIHHELRLTVMLNCTQITFETLKASIQGGLYDHLREFVMDSQQDDSEMEGEIVHPWGRFIECVAESASCDPTTDYHYFLVHEPM
jgi:hypothetical protein